MTTPKQLTANHSNSSKSTGPKTQPGRNLSRLNALRHGAFAEHLVLLPGENPADFAALRRAYRELYKPANQTEHFLVDRMILAAWRLMRLTTLEPRILQVHHETGAGNSLRTREMLGLFRGLILGDYSDTSQSDAGDSEATPLTYADPIAHAYVRDSQHGNAVAKLTRAQIAWERSYYRALHELQNTRGNRKQNQPKSQPLF